MPFAIMLQMEFALHVHNWAAWGCMFQIGDFFFVQTSVSINAVWIYLLCIVST